MSDSRRCANSAPSNAAYLPTHFPDGPSKAHVLPVDHVLTYERFKSFNFDPNAEYLYALTLR